ncbi:MAG TPA: dTMP kinase [Defluviitaleaceae bacterium]|jgi:dTMP kinase|nr:dTMP kinase [Candidatus Epulonipiscium sp.]HOQ17049.1 dTMP kinase [Defluviitaleaceae bacterium]HPT76170.1 dTMP kinase [Defluviitaleaceae bacterium]HQD50932.1 dTMP kinase [Defluviitaleaceae bacterium]
MKGFFITMEGPDGSGKSTQISELKEYLNDKGYDVLLTREPGGTDIGEQIRKIILDVNNSHLSYMAETLLYAASRAQHVEEKIKPALEAGKVVICDRFIDSSLVYQGYARKLGIELVESINQFALMGIQPDITFFFDIKPEEAMDRKQNQKALDRLEKENISFHHLVYEGYKILLDRYPKRIRRIDASQSIDEVKSQILGEIDRFLKEEGLK